MYLGGNWQACRLRKSTGKSTSAASTTKKMLLANYEKFHGQEAQRREALLSHYDTLNADGQQKAVERVQELTEIPRYKKN